MSAKLVLPGVVALACLTSGCDPVAFDGFRSNSSNVVMLDDGAGLLVADADNGTLVQVDLETGDLTTLLLGLEPSRIARVGDLAFVSLRAEGVVAVVRRTEGRFEVVERIGVGGEPFGVVASVDGRHVYVALSTADRVTEIDVETFAVGRKFTVPDQPRWLAAHPSGRALFVGCAMNGSVFRLDLGNGELEAIPLPPMTRGIPETGETVPLTPRVTGDLAIDPEGKLLAIPGLYVDHSTSVGGPDPFEDGPVDDGFPDKGQDGYAAGDPEGLTRFNPAVVTVPLGGGGGVQDGALAMLVSGRVARTASDDTIGLDMRGRGEEPGQELPGLSRTVRGYLSSLLFTPDGHAIVASVEGGAAVVVLAAKPVSSGRPDDFGGDDVAFKEPAFFGAGDFEFSPKVLVGTAAGPQGLAVDDEGLVRTFGFLDRAISTVDALRAEDELGAIVDQGFPTQRTWFAGADVQLEPSILSPDVLAGRELFFSSSLPTMASEGAGVSCATCHFDGRNDGLTWTFDHGLRQTPSLAGQVSATAPITWTNTVATVDEEVRLTSQGRMGGHGITERQTLQVASFIDWTRDVVPPKQDDAALARGKLLFERADVGCAACHTGDRYTDNRSYDMVGERGVNTPPLKGIVATAPYFHDGRAKTLRQVLEMADEVGMGSTARLSSSELDDLETYLRSL